MKMGHPCLPTFDILNKATYSMLDTLVDVITFNHICISHKDVEEIDLDAVMVGCDCYECNHEEASACDCQAPSRLHNRNEKIFAYTPDVCFTIVSFCLWR